MNYWIISSNLAHSGNTGDTYDVELKDSYWDHWNRKVRFSYQSFPDTLVEPKGYILYPHIKPVDFLQFPTLSTYGMVCSARLLEYILSMKTPPLRFIEFSIERESGNSLKYFWVVFKYEAVLKKINIEHSRFHEEHFYRQVEMDIKSVEELLALLGYREESQIHRGIVGTSKLVLNQSFDLDLFCVGQLSDFTCSDKFKQGFAENGFTGIEFTRSRRISRMVE